MKIIAKKNEEIDLKAIGKNRINYFGWTDNRKIDFEIGFEINNPEEYNIKSEEIKPINYKIKFEGAFDLKIKLTNLEIKTFKFEIDKFNPLYDYKFNYELNDNMHYEISIKIDSNEYLKFECYNYYLEAEI